MQQSTHEDLLREKQNNPSSERSFAVVMAVTFFLVGGINWWHDGRVWRGLGIISALFVVLGYFWPTVLKPFNWLWFKFGLLLHALISPIVMSIVFYGAVLPVGLAMRVTGKDLLRLKLEPDRNSYWIKRQPPGPEPKSLKDQF
jgi:hypothetical protein